MTITVKEMKALFKCWKEIMAENRDFLIETDSIVGDGDLGLTMSDGFAAAYNAAATFEEADIGKLCYMAGKAMSVAVPSTMGTLMASGLMQAGKTLKGRVELSLLEIGEMFDAFLQGVMARGKAKLGEKTFLDGFSPAVEALKVDGILGRNIVEAAKNAASAAKAGYESTNTMIAIHGRAATRGEKSRELLDPGAAVAMLMMEAFAINCKIM